MKKYSVLFLLSLSSIVLFAQKGKVYMAESLLAGEKPDAAKAKEIIKEAVSNEKSAEWPKTHIVKARIYSKTFEENKKTEDAFEAFEALKEAYKFDQRGNAKGKGKGKFKNEIILAAPIVRTALINSGVTGFNTKDYNLALNGFEQALILDQMEFSKAEDGSFTVDTSIMFNASIAAYYAENYDKTVELINKVKDLNYGNKDEKLNIYRILYQVYKEEQKDTVNTEKLLQEAIVEFPEEGEFLNNLVLIYVKSNNGEKALKYLDAALAKDPEKSVFWFAKGTFLDQKGNKDGAIECYQKSISAADNDIDLYNGNYNLGVLFFNKAVDLMQLAQDEKDYNKYKEKEQVAFAAFKDVIPYFEKCDELQPNELPVLETLSNIYYRLTKVDNTMQAKYKSVKAKIDTIKNK